MALGKSAAVVIGGFPLGESDRVVSFYSREYGRLHGVAKAARRMRSRFGGALELFTLGELVFFDTGRSDLLRVDHFDVTRPFEGLRGDLDRLGHASWVVECVGRLTAERDRHVALFGLLVRALRTIETAAAPADVAVCFGVRCLDVLGHRPRLDRCGTCGRAYPFPEAAVDESGLVCPGCRLEAHGARPVTPAALRAFERLRALPWDEAVGVHLGRLAAELASVLDLQVSRLIGQPTRTPKFLREVRRLTPLAGEPR
jgi:DNA repair protein RecO (recombination protein O)